MNMPNNFEPDVLKLSGSIIKVIGVGGGGCNAVNHMFEAGIQGVEFFVCNTDAQALVDSPVPNKVQLGLQLTEGLGAGSQPEEGRKAALESVTQINDILTHNTKMAFITAGMGGGTGTGAAPVIAKISKELGILTVGIVTLPFEDEGPERIKQALEGLENMKPHVDAILTISNDRIVDIYGDLGISEAFSKADDILCTAAKGIAEIITTPGKLNVDFKDVQTAMTMSGRAIMGTGVATGDDRAKKAVEMAMDSPLLDSTKIQGAKHLLVNFKYGNKEPRLSETAEVKRYLQAQAGNGAHLKMGITQDSDLGEEISITVIATGFAAPESNYSHLSTHIDEILIDENEPAVGVEPTLLSADDIDDGFIDQAPRGEGIRTSHREEAIQRYSVDLNVPAFMRRNITVELPPLSTDDKVSRIVIGEQEEETRDTSIKPNKYLHDNVD
jgi:cell division protein FtsZ